MKRSIFDARFLVSGPRRVKVIALLIVCIIFVMYTFSTSSYDSEGLSFKNGSAQEDASDPPQVNPDFKKASGSTGSGSTGSGSGSLSASKHTKEVLEEIRNYELFFKDLEAFKPDVPSLKGNYVKDKAKELFVTDDSFLMSKDYLRNVLDLPEESVEKLKKAHSEYVEKHLNVLIDKYGIATFGNILPSDPEWSQSYSGLSGYVLIGGDKYSWMSYLVIKQIRKTGSKLPIEVFIASSSEYEKDFCEEVLPKLNARCNVFSDKLAANLADRFNIGGYQYKMLALLSSKFENILYLDSDGFPTVDLDYLFTSKEYKANSMIVWPDAWARTTNPEYYNIAGIKVSQKKHVYANYDKKKAKEAGTELPPLDLDLYDYSNTWYHTFEGTLPDPSSETGILLINKTKHLKTLLMALYYNVYGPQHYYPLLTQGSAGEGDKETFIAAATVMKQPVHQVMKTFKWCGYVKEDNNEFTSKALGHYDPHQAAVDIDGDVKIVFMHLSYPKLLPSWLAHNHDLIYEGSGNHIRMYRDAYASAGYDFDLRILQLFTEGVCANYYNEVGAPIDGEEGVDKSTNYMGKYLSFLKENEGENAEWCTSIFIPHLKWLKKTTKEEFSA